MLQRAASNAYSWWWASHIRTKQSKWMEQNLQDMEEKVQVVLKLIEEDGDSFAKRAEMYYKKRPELIHFVEESYRAYRALAERYDHISRELQNANSTIASIFPDQVPFMDDDYEEASPRPPRKLPEGFKPNIPKVPNPPIKNLKSAVMTTTKKLHPKKTAAAVASPKGLKSGLSRKETLEEIDKLQKQILALQTVKEFVKSSYDNAIARYWETEEQIKELQERVFSLQDELGEGIIIEDNEARRLMAEAALKSCQETLTQLQEKQEKSINETRIETAKIKDVKEKLESLMDEFQYNQINQKELRAKRDVKEGAEVKDFDEDVDRMTQQRQNLQLLQEKIKEHFEAGSYSSLSVTEMAEKIDDLVNKVISLENAVSSQTALVKRLRTDTDELQFQIRTLENDKASLLNDKTKLNNQLREMEEKMRGAQDLNQIVESQNTNLQTHFTEARCNLDHLSEKVQNVQPDEVVEVMYYSHRERKSSGEVEPKYKVEGQEALNQENVLLNDVNSDKEFKVTGFVQDDVKSDIKLKVTGFVEDDVKSDNKFMITSSLENDVQTDNELKVTDTQKMEEAHPVEMELPRELKEQEETMNLGNGDEKAVDALSTSAGTQYVSQHQARNKADSSSESSGNQQEIDAKATSSETQNFLNVYAQEKATAPEGEPNWRQLFMNGLQDREKVLLLEYTNTLRNFKDVKKQLAEVEKKYQGYFDTSLQLKELKHASVLKDEEIRFLRQKLVLLQGTFEGKEELVELTSPMPTEKQDIEAMLKFEEPNSTSAIEEKFRMSIDEILEENLEFWLKFSTSITKIQKFETTIKDLLTEVSKLEEKGKSSEDSSSTKYSLKSDVRPIYQHLVEIQTELTVWLEKSALLKEELKCRFSSFCDIQEEITQALKASAEDDDFKFTSYQAAKFQGEILNMKQENNRVAAELQAGLDHVTTLQLDVEKALAELIEKFGLTTSKRQQSSNMRQTESWNRFPLGSFIFGVKPKKQKQSIFSCMTPGMHKKYRSRDKSHM